MTVISVDKRKVRVPNEATGLTDVKDAWVVELRGVHGRGMAVTITSETENEILKYSKGKAYQLEL